MVALASCDHQKCKLRIVAGADGFLVAELRVCTVVWTAIDSIAENFVFFFLQPQAIKSKTSAYMEHLLQNVVDFALITKAFM